MQATIRRKALGVDDEVGLHMLEKVGKRFSCFDVLGNLTGELFRSGGFVSFADSWRDTLSAGGFQEGLKFALVERGNVLAHDFMERDVRIEVLKVSFVFFGWIRHEL